MQRNSKQALTKMSQFWCSQGRKSRLRGNMSKVITTRKKRKERKIKKINYEVNKFDFFSSFSRRENEHVGRLRLE